MFADTFEELVAAERMADIRRQVAEGRLQSSLKDERDSTERTSVRVLQISQAKVAEIADEAFRYAA